MRNDLERFLEGIQKLSKTQVKFSHEYVEATEKRAAGSCRRWSDGRCQILTQRTRRILHDSMCEQSSRVQYWKIHPHSVASTRVPYFKYRLSIKRGRPECSALKSSFVVSLIQLVKQLKRTFAFCGISDPEISVPLTFLSQVISLSSTPQCLTSTGLPPGDKPQSFSKRYCVLLSV